jgi:hypothetical protein
MDRDYPENPNGIKHCSDERMDALGRVYDACLSVVHDHDEFSVNVGEMDEAIGGFPVMVYLHDGCAVNPNSLREKLTEYNVYGYDYFVTGQGIEMTAVLDRGWPE